jgi:nucleotide-binding universal stress UspA family protein
MEAQPSTKSMLPKTILVGLDGSAGSARALDWATAMAKALDAEIVAVHVVQSLSPSAVGLGLAPIELPDNWLDDLRGRFENEWTAPLRQAGEVHPDLIVTGSRGLGGFGELLLGSVSHQLVLHAQVPVVVIPAERRPVAVAAQPVSELASVAAP